MKKRMLAMLLVVTAVLTLCACGNGNQDDPVDTTANTQTTEPDNQETDAAGVETTAPEQTEPDVTDPDVEITVPGETVDTTAPDATDPTEETVPEPTVSPTESADEATKPVTPTDPPATKPSTTKPSTTKPSATKPVTPTDPPATEAAKPSTTKPSATKPAATKPTDPPATEPVEGSTKDNAIACYPDSGDPDSFTVNLTKIPGKSSLYFNLYRVGGMKITIENSNAYVVYNGTKYTAKNGKVTFTVENVSADKAVLVQVGNTASSAKTFVLKCNAPKGTFENPETLKKADGSKHSVHIEENDDQGYFYTYTAEKDGTLVFNIQSASNSANVNFRVTCDNYQATPDKSVEISVKKGDVVQIIIFSDPNDYWEIPATDVVWTVKYQ